MLFESSVVMERALSISVEMQFPQMSLLQVSEAMSHGPDLFQHLKRLELGMSCGSFLF